MILPMRVTEGAAARKFVQPRQVGNLAPPPGYGSDVVLMTGAGASRYLGLPTLDGILKLSEGTLRDSDSKEILVETRKSIQGRKWLPSAVFEEIIAQLREY